MKHSRYIVAVVFVAALLIPTAAFAGHAEGESPQTVTQPCSLYTPTLVSLTIEDSVHIILTAGSIGDSIWPKYFHPTYPASAPYSFVEYWSNNSAGVTIAVKGDGDFLTDTVTLGQLYYGPTGETKTSNGGANPGGNWVAFTTGDVKFDSLMAPGSEHSDRDYEFKWEVDDPAVSAGVVLTYTAVARVVE